jgi:hypothetical protein
VSRNQVVSGVWRLLEQSYLDSAVADAKGECADLSEPSKQKALLDFANKQATMSKRWAAILRNLRSLGPDG